MKNKKGIMEIIFTDNSNSDFIVLTERLDAELDQMYGELQKHYHPLNKASGVKQVVLVYDGEAPAACGAYKELDTEAIELKRVYVCDSHRGEGISKIVVRALEEDARRNGYTVMYLETGVKQTPAIKLYRSCGYEIVENYGPYAGDTNSICMRKVLR